MEKITRMPAVSSRKLTIVSGYRCVILMVGLICCIIVSDAFMMGARVLRTCRSRDFSREVINIVQKGRDLTVFATDDNDSEIEEMPINNGEVLKDFLDIADNTESVEDDRINDESNAEESNELPSQRQLVWNAAVKSSVRVKELERTVEEYMRLPASEYSVLTASQISRISDTEFKCTLPAMNFFGTKIQPLLYVDVNVYPEFNRSEIVVRRAETVGSESAERINGTFSINAINVVSAATDDKGRKTLNSETTLVINVLVPPSKFPLRVIQSGGNFLMQSSLNIIVPTFVRILSRDFERWSTGNNTRAEVEGAVLSTT